MRCEFCRELTRYLCCVYHCRAVCEFHYDILEGNAGLAPCDINWDQLDTLDRQQVLNLCDMVAMQRLQAIAAETSG